MLQKFENLPRKSYGRTLLPPPPPSPPFKVSGSAYDSTRLDLDWLKGVGWIKSNFDQGIEIHRYGTGRMSGTLPRINQFLPNYVINIVFTLSSITTRDLLANCLRITFHLATACDATEQGSFNLLLIYPYTFSMV